MLIFLVFLGKFFKNLQIIYLKLGFTEKLYVDFLDFLGENFRQILQIIYLKLSFT